MSKQALEILEEIRQAYENTPIAEYMGNPEYIALPAKIEAIDGAIHRIKRLPSKGRGETENSGDIGGDDGKSEKLRGIGGVWKICDSSVTRIHRTYIRDNYFIISQ